MQLKQLKLSGFKSFVDPTVVPFSSQLVAVVGPNGCGKSNIIDAVRWVMGEGSAKTLRGESMTDVIFNGSTERKPVGQASIELVFDNNLGRFSGQFANYQEIAIKRLVTRDGESCYFLNGSRCRRRDITDLFLGTGAGARGYSIIGQNTISQLVEAKPEELRAYFEEAAGVSKYKERRRETMQRIQQTRENLARVDDISGELASQLQRLERQAKSAEQYKSLKQAERQCKGDILALKWQHLSQEQEQKHVELTRVMLTHEEHQTRIANSIKTQALLENQLVDAQVVFQTIQTQFYQTVNEITRLQEIQQQQVREKQRWVADQQQVSADIQLAERQIQDDTEAYQIGQTTLSGLLQRAQELKQIFEDATHVLQAKQQEESQWNQARQDIQAVLNQHQREVQVDQVKLQHLEQRHQDIVLRLEKIQMEQQGIEVESGHEILQALYEQQVLANESYQKACEHHQQCVQQGLALSEQAQVIEQQLRAAQDHLQTLTTQHAAMSAAQQSALRDINLPISDLALFQKHPRLVELITVEEPWRSVCEWVLGESLNATTLDELDLIWPNLESLAGRSAVFVTPMEVPNDASAFPRLLDKIDGFKPSWLHSLEHVFTAQNLEEAMRWQKTLERHQSVITADGFWFGVGWLKVANFAEHDETSLLLRKKALIELQETLNLAKIKVDVLQANRDDLHALRAENERQQHESKISCTDLQRACTEVTAQHHQKKQAIEQSSLRMSHMQDEQGKLVLLLEELVMERQRMGDALTVATKHTQKSEQQWNELIAQKSRFEEALPTSRFQAEEARTALHQAESQCDREQLKAQQLSDAIVREQTRLDTLRERLLVLNQRYSDGETSEVIPAVFLQSLIEQHARLETELNHARQQIEDIQLHLKEAGQSKLKIEQSTRVLQEQMVQLQMAEQALVLRAGTLVESLAELEIDAQARLADLSSDNFLLEDREQEFLEIGDKIKRLGAINLVAIEEYQTELARKTHLDDQSRDLKEAISTLETAIAKMDQETQSRLKETFDQVNTLFQALFPRLFGGGQAHLQLTSDNLLEAGIVVMAQPPGKRNSTIHLLSGGEKALTAVALVFAIFQLNPSPFCMLDEVDAPLDDLNVRRFCDLVKEMSQQVQFLLITHNKVTMELSEHLIGVTMREPGVSRIVTVDVDEALSLVDETVK